MFTDRELFLDSLIRNTKYKNIIIRKVNKRGGVEKTQEEVDRSYEECRISVDKTTNQYSSSGSSPTSLVGSSRVSGRFGHCYSNVKLGLFWGE